MGELLLAGGAIAALVVALFFTARQQGKSAERLKQEEAKAEGLEKAMEKRNEIGELSDAAVSERLRRFRKPKL